MSLLISYAQNGEDILLHRAFANQESGFYVDIGASDPVVCSVTKHFYDRGWRGINVEPSSSFDALSLARPRDINLRLAVSDTNGSATLYEIPSLSAISSLDDNAFELGEMAPLFADMGQEYFDGLVSQRRAIPVEVKTLATILDAHVGDNTIDFLKIDVEGHERQVIEGNDWSRFRPRVVVVEATKPMSTEPAWLEWEGKLLEANYRLAFFDGLNRYFVRNESIELLPLLSTPPNVFDGFISVQLVEAQRRALILEAELTQERKARMTVDTSEAERSQHAEALEKSETEQMVTDLTAENNVLRREVASLRRGTGPKTLAVALHLARLVHEVWVLSLRIRSGLSRRTEGKG